MPIQYTDPVTIPTNPNYRIDRLHAAGDALSQLLGAFAKRRENKSVDAEREAQMVMEAISKGQLPPDSAAAADAIAKLEKRNPGRARIYRDMLEWIKQNPEDPDPMETFYDRMDQVGRGTSEVMARLPIDAMGAPPMGGPPGMVVPPGPMDIGGGGIGGMQPLGGGMQDFMGPEGAPFTPQPQAGGAPPAPPPAAAGAGAARLPADFTESIGSQRSLMAETWMRMAQSDPSMAQRVLEEMPERSYDLLMEELEEAFDPYAKGVSGIQIAACAVDPNCQQNLPPEFITYQRGEMGYEGTPGQVAAEERRARKATLEEEGLELREEELDVRRGGLEVRRRKEARIAAGGGDKAKKFKEKTLPSTVSKQVRELMDRDLEVYVPTRDMWVPAEKKPKLSAVLDRAAAIYNMARQQGMDDQAAEAVVMEKLMQQIRRKSIRDE